MKQEYGYQQSRKKRLAEALITLIDYEELRRSFVENERRRVLEYFTIENMISKHIEIYNIDMN